MAGNGVEFSEYLSPKQIGDESPILRTVKERWGHIFTERSRWILLGAEESAEAEGVALRKKHIILGMTRDDASLASRVLRNMGVDFELLNHAVIILDETDENNPEDSLSLVKSSLEEAGDLKHAYVGTEHFLLAALKTHASPAFDQFGITYERSKEEIIKLLGESKPI